MKNNIIRNSIKILCTLCLVLSTTFSYSQKHKHDNEEKSKEIVVQDGAKYYLHTVGKGQTLFAIAKIYDKSVNDIVLENPEAIDGIKPGQVIRIPFDKPKKKVVAKDEGKEIAKETPKIDSTKFIFHKVEKGQTLYSIGKMYGISDKKIKELNPETNDGLRAGQIIKIPSDKKQPEKPFTPAVVVAPAEIKKEVIEEKPKNYTKIKDEYNIAFFLPFHAEEANEMDIERLQKGEDKLPNKTVVALNFYEGAMLAIDSLRKQKLNAKIFVYDIDDKDSAGIANTLAKPELTTMDLIIGPLYTSSFMPFSIFAKKHNIPIVSPFIQANKILFNNPQVCKIQPSATLQVERMAHFVVDSFAKENIIEVEMIASSEAALFNTFKNTANAELIKMKKDTVKRVKGLAGVESALSDTKINIIVLPTSTNDKVIQPYVTEFVRGLHVHCEKHKLVLFGMQSWLSYDNLDFDYLNTLQLHLPANNFVDYQKPNTKRMITSYRDKYKTEPDMSAYQGFDVAYYFISALQKYGTGFLSSLPDIKYEGVESNFQFQKPPTESGFENKYINMLKIQDYKLVPAN